MARPKGWVKEPYRHGLASKGIPTAGLKKVGRHYGRQGDPAKARKAGWRPLTNVVRMGERGLPRLWIHTDTEKISKGVPGGRGAGSISQGYDETGGEGVYANKIAAEFEADGLRDQNVPGEDVYVSSAAGMPYGFFEVITDVMEFDLEEE